MFGVDRGNAGAGGEARGDLGFEDEINELLGEVAMRGMARDADEVHVNLASFAGDDAGIGLNWGTFDDRINGKGQDKPRPSLAYPPLPPSDPPSLGLLRLLLLHPL